ncbi:MAG: hypothetical protein A3K19_28360 [Lentisphaerae bacterium RIFOXYB12_FULL_65_16]|nr:MAG: hypothetical protein A3K18_19610 [Lentisphaerae bacterium RIFOXYA12_64_32]OGV85501.1 MAG: hypothetical protein A3K19_28360 [Lentisphaerae bacterium RIFOXYB12_FULL_65_16]
MKELARLLEEMTRLGVIQNYAIFGAVAQMRYTEAVVTMDADVLVEVKDGDNLAILAPIYEFCKKKGYYPEGEAIRVGAWPVQFIPTFDDLTADAIHAADQADLHGVGIRVVTADYLAIIALKAGRPKDMARILALLDSESVSVEDLEKLARKYNLSEPWIRFKGRFIDER